MTYPQSQTALESLPIDHPQHLWQQKACILKNVTLPEPVVHPDAKLSDFLSTTATWRLVMSPKLKGILEKFIKEGQCQFLEMIEPPILYGLYKLSIYRLLRSFELERFLISFY
jgi:hypothetical protein